MKSSFPPPSMPVAVASAVTVALLAATPSTVPAATPLIATLPEIFKDADTPNAFASNPSSLINVMSPEFRIVSCPQPPAIPIASALAKTAELLAAVPETSAVETPLKLSAAETLSSAATPVASAVERRRMFPSLSIVSSPRPPSIPKATAWAITLLSPTASPVMSASALPLIATAAETLRPADTLVAVEFDSRLTMFPVLLMMSFPAPPSIATVLVRALALELLAADPEVLASASPLKASAPVISRDAATLVVSECDLRLMKSPELVMLSSPSPPWMAEVLASAVTLASLTAAPVTFTFASPSAATPAEIFTDADTPVAVDSA